MATTRFFNELYGFHAADVRNPEQRTGGGSKRFRIRHVGRSLEKNNTARPKGLGATNDSPGVAGILDAVERHNEGNAAEQIAELPSGRFH
ncbi:MAG: hypothetical protein O2968_13370 [Acidobacteria bacterium]|nr:hypothetical protein [Acidobacteriota bacterium]